MNSQEYYLNIRPGEGYAQTVKVSQGDIGRPLLFHLMDGANPLTITAGSDVIIHATKPSGLGFTEACSFSGSSVSVSSTLEMTQEFGLFPAEIVVSLNDEVLATANFSILVERSPHPDGTTDGTKEELDDLYTEVNQLKEDLSGWSDDTKVALLNAFAHVAWTDEHGQDYYDALEAALYPEEPPATLESISAVYTQSGTVYDTDTLDSLKADLVVTAHYSDSTTVTVPSGYTLSGTLTDGTSTVTVTYDDKTTTFNVTVTRLEIKVYKGKGTSGTSIIDNANRALSEAIALSFGEPVYLRFPERANNTYTMAVKFCNGSSAITSFTPSIVPDTFIGIVHSIGDYGAYIATDESLCVAERTNTTSKWNYVTNQTSGIGDGNVRLLFVNVADNSTPITATIDDVLYINEVPYHLVEDNIANFS